jgi:hypothetical protein
MRFSTRDSLWLMVCVALSLSLWLTIKERNEYLYGFTRGDLPAYSDFGTFRAKKMPSIPSGYFVMYRCSPISDLHQLEKRLLVSRNLWSPQQPARRIFEMSHTPERNDAPDAQSCLNAHSDILLAAEQFLSQPFDDELARLESAISKYRDLNKRFNESHK